jgi:carbon starvation protein CstA
LEKRRLNFFGVVSGEISGAFIDATICGAIFGFDSVMSKGLMGKKELNRADEFR